MSWSDLPADLAAGIADRLTELADLARFRSVCPSWRSASAAHAARRRVPLLLLPTQKYDTRVSRRVWSLTDDSLGEIPLPAARGRSFLFASHHGWILAVSGGNLSVTLVHPFTGASSGLPALPFSSRGDYDTIPRELVWDWSPHGVLVSPGKGAFFCRPGDESWRPLSCSSAVVSSVSYCDGAFYFFDGKTCKATVVDPETLAVAAVIQPPALDMPWWPDFEANLVVSPDELLLIVKKRWEKKFFKAFRADRAAAGGLSSRWSEVAGIGDRAVFVDHLRAFCVEANGLNGVRSNCMYVATSYEAANDDYGLDVNGMYRVSILDFADLTTEDLGFGNLWDVWCSCFWQYPSWLLPNLH
ncbi:uncharacterized protein LOC133929035 [Phragmites australis]|uniref:uncharacterized protein LOC133929035 n=1 Tax=Phragmites australis TaxID=29695 RepID=UPI002D7716CA|nr:uncharacterized protein LOC133929035 [Phragmites australis]